MANTILTADVIAREAIDTLYSNAVMANLVYRGVDSDFGSEVLGHRVGDTISVPQPTTFVSDSFSGTITVQNATESSVPVVLDKHEDVSFTVTSAELTLDISQFSRRFVQPATRALAQQVDIDLLTLRNDVANSVTFDVTDAWGTAIEARKALNLAKVPIDMRQLVWSSNGEAAVLKDARFSSAEQVGDDGTAFREASLGRAAGFSHFLDQNADDTAESVAFHPTAFILATSALYLPEGAADAAQVSFGGLTIRVVMDYDISTKAQTVSLDVLYGVKTFDADRAVIVSAIS